MPGLKQLEKFNSDILSLGNEAELRSKRGEDVILPPIPPSVKDEDDSDDFVVGLPVKKDEPENASAASLDNANAVVDVPDINSIGRMEGGDDMPDLSMFDDEAAVENPSEETAAPPENEEPEISDMGLDALLGDFESLTDLPHEDDTSASSGDVLADDELFNSDLSDDMFSGNDDAAQLNEASPFDALPNLDEMPALDELPHLDETPRLDDASSFDELSSLNAPPTLDEASGLDALPDLDETASLNDASGDMPVVDNPIDTSTEKKALDEAADFAEVEDFSLPDIPDDDVVSSPVNFDDLNDLSLPDDLGGSDNVSASDDLGGLDSISLPDSENSASDDLGGAQEPGDLNFLDSSDDLTEIESVDDFNNADSENYVQPGESFSLDDLASFVGEDGDASNLGDVSGDDVSQGGAEDFADLSAAEASQEETNEKPSNTVDDDLGFEIEDYSAPEDSHPTGEGALSADASKESPVENSAESSASLEAESPNTMDDDLGFEIEDYSAPEDSSLSENALNGMSASEEAKPDAPDESADNNSLDDLDFNIEDYAAPSEPASSNADLSDLFSQGSDDGGLSDLDGSGNNGGLGDDLAGSDNLGESDFGLDEGIPEEPFDTSAMEGLEFPSTDEQLSEDGFELSGDSDILDDAEFEIPGFSDVATIEEKKKGKDSRQKGDEEEDLGLPPNTLSDEQYKKFLDNLATYPLNVRIALEQLIVDDEFTDETEFGLIKKVIKKVPARQLASELEKMLDIAIPVPRDFERRTTEEYEAYKSSLQYQIKNRIVPAIALGVVAAGLCTLFFLFGKHFIYEPARASSLYRQGYALLENDDYPQSEIKFNEASKYDAQKKWFFRYARAYRDKKQYIRAEQMYRAILTFFSHDKQAGLEYARMELEDLANYEKAETVLLRDCLDYHINDADCLLLLGDTYLEWATEKDPLKFEDARNRYSELISLYGETDLYMSRMLRYFIRTDNLLKVLELKTRFMPKKKESALGAEDWTALSGFLLDKLYGYLKPSEEYLRNKIEDVKETLARAYRADPGNPIALYNFSRYYMVMNNNSAAQAWLLNTIDAFSKTPSLKRRDMYKYINSYKFLGEQLMEQRDYLKAREAYTSGISLFNSERERSNLAGTSEIGELYADMADIDYFIAGDMDAAKANYELSINNYNDNGKIRYKIGNIQYGRKNYSEALGSFMKAAEEYPDDPSLLIAMGNTLSMRDDVYASMGYYDHLKNILDLERAQRGILFPQTDAREAELVDTYMRTANNLGVSLYKLSRLTGDSSLNAQAIVNFQESLRAWDALTRNQQTMVRLGGSNLAEQNIRYLLQSIPQFEPAIYTEIPNTLTAEEGIVP